jgi:hypothetical protein
MKTTEFKTVDGTIRVLILSPRPHYYWMYLNCPEFNHLTLMEKLEKIFREPLDEVTEEELTLRGFENDKERVIVKPKGLDISSDAIKTMLRLEEESEIQANIEYEWLCEKNEIPDEALEED